MRAAKAGDRCVASQHGACPPRAHAHIKASPRQAARTQAAGRTWCTDTMSPRRTRRFLRTTLLMRILVSSTVSSASTMHTVSRRFLPCGGGGARDHAYEGCTSHKRLPRACQRARTRAERGKAPRKSHLQQHGVAAEQLQLLHGRGVQRDHRVIIVDGLVHHQAVGGLLPLQDGSAEVLLFARVRGRSRGLGIRGTCLVSHSA